MSCPQGFEWDKRHQGTGGVPTLPRLEPDKAAGLRKAQEIAGKADITAADMRNGMEALVVDAARLEALGMAGFGPTVEVTCANHGGSGAALVQQWDAAAKKWNAITDFIPSDRELVTRLAMEDSEAFAKENNITQRECK